MNADSKRAPIVVHGRSMTVVEASLARRSRWYWVLLGGTALASTIGLATALLLAERMRPLWPWDNTEFVLLAALSVAMLALVGYLTEQQRQVVILRGELTRRAHQHHDRLVALLSVSRIMGTETNLQAVFDGITNTCFDAFDGEQVSLMLFDHATEELVVQSAAGHRRNVVGARQTMGQGIAGWVAAQRQAIILGREFDKTKYPGFSRREDAPDAAMVVPIVLRDELVGVLNVASRERENIYTKDDLYALEVFAQNAGTCIRHAEQAEWMRQLIETKSEPRPSGAESESFGAPTGA